MPLRLPTPVLSAEMSRGLMRIEGNLPAQAAGDRKPANVVEKIVECDVKF